jgi:hypothetical protein
VVQTGACLVERLPVVAVVAVQDDHEREVVVSQELSDAALMRVEVALVVVRP